MSQQRLLIEEIQNDLKVGRLKEAFSKIQKLTRYATPNPVVHAFKVVKDNIITDDELFANTAAYYFQYLFIDLSVDDDHLQLKRENEFYLFTEEDIKQAIKVTNF